MPGFENGAWNPEVSHLGVASGGTATAGNVVCQVMLDPNYFYADAYKRSMVRYEQGAGFTHGKGFSVLDVPYVDLEDGFTEDFSPNYADTEVVGRAEAYKTFIGSSNREVSMTFKFWAEAREDIIPGVILPARWLEGLKQPLYLTKEKISVAPPPVYLVVGRLLAMRAVVTSASVHWFGPIEVSSARSIWHNANSGSDMFFQGAEVEVQFTAVRRSSRSGAINASGNVPKMNVFMAFPSL